MKLPDSIRKRVGTLAPLSSLHSMTDAPTDFGTFATALVFIQWLVTTRQALWQLLPLHPTQWETGSETPVPSPYKGYGVGIDARYISSTQKLILPTALELNAFRTQQNDWLNDFALFCALRSYFHTDDWRTWDMSLRTRDPEVLERWSSVLAKEIEGIIIEQWQAHRAYAQVKEAANRADILMSGDLPFYLSVSSPLVWAHQVAFEVEADGSTAFVSGVTEFPPSFFGRQIWGHPLYAWQSADRWDVIVDVWKIRLRHMACLYDSLRFDYAEAFYAYGAMNVGEKHHDHNRIGPGAVVFEHLIAYARSLGLAVFVEDGGTQTIEMEESLLAVQCPGIRIFCFRPSVFRYPIVSVAFTTTHDTETLRSFVGRQSAEDKQLLAEAAGVIYHEDDAVLSAAMRSAVIASASQTVIIPIQDWLLTTDRINIPGSEMAIADPNWRYTVTIPIEEFPLNCL